MTRPKLLDIFCGAGGAAVGYHRAGFDVVGVDHKPQPRYPFPFVQADALQPPFDLRIFDAIHASPPCQTYSAAKRIGNARPGHQDLLSRTREMLCKSGRPWVIENVPGAPMRFPVVMCGTHFGLPLRRHRLFESNRFLFGRANQCRHRSGDITVFGHAVQLCGSKGTPYKDAAGRTHYRKKRINLQRGQEAMGIDWMNRAELSQAIPPAYTEFIGKQLIQAIHNAAKGGGGRQP